MEITLEDALAFVVERLRDDVRNRAASLGDYGYEFYVPNAMRDYYRRVVKRDLQRGREEDAVAPPFLNAAWELCRRGVLRPGVMSLNAQSTLEGSAGCGYCVTPFGRTWLGEPGNIFVPTEPERFAQLLEPYRERFGPGFHERAQQAMRCYDAHAYLACCAMCGAAAESVLLATACEKIGVEKATKLYLSGSGRSRLDKLLLGQVEERLRRDIQASSGLLNYWRDSSAHGRALDIADNEAFSSLAILLRLASLVTENWSALTVGSAG